ncbi:MAG: hypothetical protein RLZZ344_315 [Pseudomonadota bacterium]|jgi:lipoyl(octanoyl) transferase
MGKGRALTRWPDLRAASYTYTLKKMQAFTEDRTPETPDVFWAVEHLPVFTLGVGGLESHILDAGEIPVVRTDRGGQVTYHGPGQLVVYTLIDLNRRGLSVRDLVNQIETGVLNMLHSLGLATAQRVPGAPGIYLPHPHRKEAHGKAQDGAFHLTERLTQTRKIASLGLKVRRGRCYHGVALNLGLDHRPFEKINPCGYPGLQTTDVQAEGVALAWDTAADMLIDHLLATLYPEDTAHHDRAL